MLSVVGALLCLSSLVSPAECVPSAGVGLSVFDQEYGAEHLRSQVHAEAGFEAGVSWRGLTMYAYRRHTLTSWLRSPRRPCGKGDARWRCAGPLHVESQGPTEWRSKNGVLIGTRSIAAGLVWRRRSINRYNKNVGFPPPECIIKGADYDPGCYVPLECCGLHVADGYSLTLLYRMRGVSVELWRTITHNHTSLPVEAYGADITVRLPLSLTAGLYATRGATRLPVHHASLKWTRGPLRLSVEAGRWSYPVPGRRFGAVLFGLGLRYP